MTDGSSIWVVNNSTTDKVFKYALSGSLLGSWAIDAGGGSPTGITIDPSNVSNIWIVDNSSDRVYQFDAAATLTSGSLSPSGSFLLAAGNTNPQGLADPPVPTLTRSVSEGLPTQARSASEGSIDAPSPWSAAPPTATRADSSFDAALLAVLSDLDSGSLRKKRR